MSSGAESGLVIGVISAAIWAASVGAATLVFHWLRRLRRKRQAGAVWRNFLKDTLIIIGISQNEDFYAWEPSGLTGAGDIEAMMCVVQHLQSRHSSTYDIKIADNLEDDDWRQNLILIGGPSSNSAVNSLLPKMTNSLLFPNRYASEITILHSGRTEQPRVSWDPDRPHEVFEDYGAILFGDNPEAAGKKILFVAGGTGFGTRLAAARATTSDFLNKDLPSQGHSFIETFQLSVKQRMAMPPRETFMTGL